MKALKLLLAVVTVLAGSVLFAQKVEVDTKKSSVEWMGKKIGGQHEGFIQLKSGQLEIEDDQIIAGKFIVDMTSITVTDIEKPESNQKLVGHLKSDDFFGVNDYPTANFLIVKSSKFDQGKARVEGDITIKGKTERISFDVIKTGNVYTTKIDIDRSNFDVRYGSNSFFDNLGDRAINDIFTLDIKLVTDTTSKDFTKK